MKKVIHPFGWYIFSNIQTGDTEDPQYTTVQYKLNLLTPINDWPELLPYDIVEEESMQIEEGGQVKATHAIANQDGQQDEMQAKEVGPPQQDTPAATETDIVMKDTSGEDEEEEGIQQRQVQQGLLLPPHNEEDEVPVQVPQEGGQGGQQGDDNSMDTGVDHPQNDAAMGDTPSPPPSPPPTLAIGHTRESRSKRRLQSSPLPSLSPSGDEDDHMPSTPIFSPSRSTQRLLSSPLSSPSPSRHGDDHMPSTPKRTKSAPRFNPVVERPTGLNRRGRLPTEIREVIDLTKERVSL